MNQPIAADVLGHPPKIMTSSLERHALYDKSSDRREFCANSGRNVGRNCTSSCMNQKSGQDAGVPGAAQIAFIVSSVTKATDSWEGFSRKSGADVDLGAGTGGRALYVPILMPSLG